MKRKENYTAFLFLITTVFLFQSCSKDSIEKDNTDPIITFTNPQTSSTFPVNQALSIQAGMTDNAKIAEVHVHIFDGMTGDLLVDIHRTPGSDNYQLNETYTLTHTGLYQITLIAIDNSANETRTSVSITIN